MTVAAMPKKAFVLAAGKGERMRPLTDNCPKPLLYVGGATMLDRALDALAAAGVEDVVVNACYLADMIENHLQARTTPRVTVAREEELLETAGGVRNKIDFFGDDPFLVLNADVVWEDPPGGSTLNDLAAMWDGDRMDVLLLLHPADNIPAYAGKGDYYLPEGADRPQFAKDKDGAEYKGPAANYIFAGPRIIHPRLFDGVAPGPRGFLELFHKAEAKGRLYACRHRGEWHHVGTPEALEKTNQLFDAAAHEKKRAT